MISVKVADYCHDCDCFSPQCQTFYSDTDGVHHVIVCEYFIECRRIAKHVEKKLKEKNNA